MKATIKIEILGGTTNRMFARYRKDVSRQTCGAARHLLTRQPQYWVAEIMGIDTKYDFKRRFLRPAKDYQDANGTGTHGIYAWYILEAGKIYEMNRPISWISFERCFVTVSDSGTVVQSTKEEVYKQLNGRF